MLQLSVYSIVSLLRLLSHAGAKAAKMTWNKHNACKPKLSDHQALLDSTYTVYTYTNNSKSRGGKVEISESRVK